MATRGRRPGSLVRATCQLCARVEMARGAYSYCCTVCRGQGLQIPRAPKRTWTGKDIAQAVVSNLIKSGDLAHPKTCFCADCGKPAVEYEHRDYNFPERVEPICRACNLRRGPALPREGSIDHLVGLGWVPYRARRSVEKLFVMMGIDTAQLHGMPHALTIDHWRDVIAPAMRATRSPQEA